MRRSIAVGVFVALSVWLTYPAPAQTLLDRPLWQFLEPEPVVDLPVPEHLLQFAKAYGPSGANGSGAPASSDELSESEYNSIGCIVGGTVGMLAALAVGGPSVVNMIAGGGVVAAGPGTLYAAMTGVVFATFCAVGQAATPAVMLAYRNATTMFAAQDKEPASRPARPAEEPPPPLLGRLIKISDETTD